MSIDGFREKTRLLLMRMLDEASTSDRAHLVETYADLLAGLHAADTHEQLRYVLEDAKVRLNARLSPDPVSQGLASVQTTMQDLWDAFWRGDQEPRR